MQPRVDFRIGASFQEFVGLAGKITCKQPFKIEKIASNENTSSKIDVSKVTGKITALRISKSLIRQLIYKGEPYPVCPYKVYHTLLLKDVKIPPSESMIKGLYFESKCLGLSADGNTTIDLPRHKKTGNKLADHERIDQAVERFSQVKEDYRMVIDRRLVQVYKKIRWMDNEHSFAMPVFLDGTLDFMSPITTSSYSHPMATIDLKLTKDRDVCESFSNGLFHATPWGNMEAADFTEAMMYRVIFGKPFIYLVFDYKGANAGFKDIPVITDINDTDRKKASKAQNRMADLRNTIRWVVNAVMKWQNEGWPMTAIAKVCATCPIKDCPKRSENSEI